MYDPFELMKQKFALTRAQAEGIKDPEWVIENLIVRGMLHMFPAKYNSGKTTLFTYLFAEKMMSDGYDVTYLNADCSAVQAKVYREFAEKKGFNLLLPEITPATSIQSARELMEEMSHTDMDYSNQVFIVDTLKKFCDVNNKSSVKAALQLFRRLTNRGMTVILLHHTTKHTNEQGEPIYEGTNEIATEPDQVIYLETEKLADKTIISTKVEKNRAVDFKSLTWELRWIEDTPSFTSVSHVSIDDLQRARKQYEDDETGIQLIADAIRSSHHTRRNIEDACYQQDQSKRQTGRILAAYKIGHGVPGVKECWKVTRMTKNNSDYYELLPPVNT
jgi:archaellum biogenesis ATPase FlaH